MTKVCARDLVTRLVDVFRGHGFDGASLTVLADGTGLGRASLYHHFPGGKEAMARAAYDRVSRDFTRHVLAPLAGSDPPSERLMRMVDGLDAFYDGGRNACLVDVFTIGSGREHFAADIADAISYWNASVARVVAEAGISQAEAVRRAEDAVMVVEGALVLARATGRLEPFRRALEDLPARLLRPEGVVPA